MCTCAVEGVRLGDFLDRFEVAVACHHGEDLARSIRPHSRDRGKASRQCRTCLHPHPEAWRHVLLKHLDEHGPPAGHDGMRPVMVVRVLSMVVSVIMPLMMAAAA